MEFYSIRNFSKSRVQDDSWIGEMKKKFYLRFNERMVNQFFFFLSKNRNMATIASMDYRIEDSKEREKERGEQR